MSDDIDPENLCYDGKPYVNGLCDDQVSVPISSGIVCAILVIYFLALFIAFVWQCRTRAMKAHGIMLTLCGFFASMVYCFPILFRLIVGRKNFPCFIYVAFFSLSPLMFVNMVLRVWRLIFITLLNRSKVQLVQVEKSEEANAETASTVTQSCEVPTQGDDKELDDVSCKEESTTSWAETSKTDLRNEELFGNAGSGVPSNNDRLRHRIRILSLLQSDGLILFINVLFCVSHAIMLIAAIVIQESLNLRDSGQIASEWLVYDHPNLFGSEFLTGCAISTLATSVLGLECILFSTMAAGLLVVACILRVRDAWGVMVSVWLTACTWIIIGAIFIVLSLIPFFYYFLDYYFPYGLMINLALALDATYNVLAPLITSIRTQKKTESATRHKGEDGAHIHDELEQALHNDATRKRLLKFAERSFCPEPVMCWQDCERFLKAKGTSARKRQAAFIISTYLEHNAPLEINLAASQRRLQERWERAKDRQYLKQNHRELFHDIQEHCKVDMMEVFGRFKMSSSHTP